MTALARPEPAPLDTSAFGRVRDDRLPLLVAGGGAIVLHFLAAFIPLPDKAQPEPKRVFEPPRLQRYVPPAPELPDPPAPKPPAANAPLLPVPMADIPDHLMVVDRIDAAQEPVEFIDDFDVPSLLGEIDAPPAPAPPAFYDAEHEGLVLPVPIYRPDPEFPDLARQIRKSGRVIFRAVVDASGNVGEIEVVFAPDPDFGYTEEAIRAVRKWRYQPGQLGGRAVPVRLTVRVDFELH